MTNYQKPSMIHLNFTDVGSGFPLVFLHGYLESLKIWTEFIPFFIPEFRVICIDLPGHGASGTAADVNTMEYMATSVDKVLLSLGIDKALIIGHSLGGYAALAMLELLPCRMAGLVLFHSHPLPDSEMVLDKRKREITIVEKGQKHLLVAQNTPNMFAEKNLPNFSGELKLTQEIARTTPDKGMIAAIRGMMARPNRSETLANANIPCLQIIGKYDQYIPFEEVSMKVALPIESQRLVLDESGHMGFFEEKEKSATGILSFLQSRFP